MENFTLQSGLKNYWQKFYFLNDYPPNISKKIVWKFHSIDLAVSVKFSSPTPKTVFREQRF